MRSVGRSTHAARTAGAHVRYITRPDAQAELLGARMPVERNAARAWLDDQEKSDRKNARVIDKIVLALPRELTLEQRAELVRAFAEKLTLGRASWLAAIHQTGADAHNPHTHLVVRDRDHETGKRVAMLSEKGACDRVRKLWEETANAALAGAQQPTAIDRRSHAVRGVHSVPQRHRGPYQWRNLPYGQFADAGRQMRDWQPPPVMLSPRRTAAPVTRISADPPVTRPAFALPLPPVPVVPVHRTAATVEEHWHRLGVGQRHSAAPCDPVPIQGTTYEGGLSAHQAAMLAAWRYAVAHAPPATGIAPDDHGRSGIKVHWSARGAGIAPDEAMSPDRDVRRRAMSALCQQMNRAAGRKGVSKATTTATKPIIRRGPKNHNK